MDLSLRVITAFVLGVGLSCSSTAQQNAVGAGSAVTPAASGSGRVLLDVVVTDKAGKPVQGLSAKDFALRDENRPSNLVSVLSSDAASEPSEVILVLDAVNMGVDEAVFVRQEFQKYLRQNEGHLAQPVSIIIFTREGMRVRPAITDGNKLAAELDQAQALLRTADLTNGAIGDIAKFQLSIKWLTTFVKSEAAKPGRKLLIWGGPGWPSLDGPDFNISSKTLQSEFNLIVDLSTALRQGRVAIYSISPALKETKTTAVKAAADQTDPTNQRESRGKSGGFTSGELNYGLDSGPFAYKNFVKGVKTIENATPPHLGLKVLAVQTGGLVLGPGNNLAEQITQCVQDVNSSYRLTFEQAHTDKPNEYHELKVEIAEKNLIVRTETGYYSQPQGQ